MRDVAIIIHLTKEELKDFIRASVADSLKEIKNKSPEQEEKEQLIKIDEVCRILKVSRVTIHQWKRKGKIPFHRISNRVFFKKSEILEALKKIDVSQKTV